MRTIMVRHLMDMQAVTTVLTFNMSDGTTRTITGYEDLAATEAAERLFNQQMEGGAILLVIGTS